AGAGGASQGAAAACEDRAGPAAAGTRRQARGGHRAARGAPWRRPDPAATEGVRPAGAPGAAPWACLSAQRAARPGVGVRLSRLHAHGRRPCPAGARKACGREGHRPQHPDGLGRRLPAGAGGGLTLRLRLLAAAAGIVAVSLLLAGALTWVFVRDLEFQSTQDQLDRQVPFAAVAVKHQECFVRPIVAAQPGGAACRLDTATDYSDRLNTAVVPGLGADRLLLLDSERRVVYDGGADQSAVGVQLPIVQSKRVANIGEARLSLGGQDYFAAAIKIPPARNPLFASFVVIAQPQSLAASAAAGDLAKRLLEAGGAALVVAMLLILLVSRSMTRPLTQLASAAEDIAAGNYARRVSIKGQDELGLLGSAFNRMAEAVERARKAQRDFLANVSHELKTPLTSLIGFSQALVDGSLLSDVERTRAASIVHEESERVLRMAQELLDLARVEAG